MTGAGAGLEDHPVEQYRRKLARHLPENTVTQNTRPERNAVRLRIGQFCFPEPVTAVWIAITYTANDPDDEATASSPDGARRAEPTAHYEETWDDSVWATRWDRHVNDHNDFEHFHYPPSPDADTDPYAFDAAYPDGVNLMAVVAQFMVNRMNDLAQSDPITFPRQYRWDGEYWPNKRVPPCSK